LSGYFFFCHRYLPVTFYWKLTLVLRFKKWDYFFAFFYRNSVFLSNFRNIPLPWADWLALAFIVFIFFGRKNIILRFYTFIALMETNPLSFLAFFRQFIFGKSLHLHLEKKKWWFRSHCHLILKFILLLLFFVSYQFLLHRM
jgi:hypothetical protein